MATTTEIEKLERRWQENPLGLTFAPLAEAYRKAGETAKALELLGVGLAQHPNYVPAHIVRGRCHVDGGAGAQAELAFRRVIELDPENAIALKGLAEIAEGEGRFSEAVGRLEVLLEVDRNNEEARGQLDRLKELMVTPAALGTEELKPFEPEDLTPAPTSEFQLSDDAIALSEGDDRYAEIELQDEVLERGLPVAEAAQGRDGLAEPDPLAAMGMASLDEEPLIAENPEPASLMDVEDALDAVLMPDLGEYLDEPDLVLTPELGAQPEPDAEPELVAALGAEPSYQPTPEPAPELRADHQQEPELSSEPEAAIAAADSELMVTETMAEIFLRQGHRELALAVYSQLAQRDPGNQRVAEASARLKEELVPPPQSPPPAAPEEAPRRFDASTTGGRSVGDVFTALLSAVRPAVASAIHPPAFEVPRRPSGEPTRPAPDALSLSAVFGEEAGPPGPAGGSPEPAAAEPSFEQFFTPTEASTAEIELPRAPESQAPAMSGMAPEDLEQFNAWLRGLKR